MPASKTMAKHQLTERQRLEGTEAVELDSKDTIKELYNIMDKEGLLLTDDDFLLPSMGDMYINSVNSNRLKEFKVNNESDEDKPLSDVAFYIDKPYTEALGVYEKDKVLFVKAKPFVDDNALLTGRYDGDTLYFSVDTVEGDPDGKAKSKITGRIENAINTLADATTSGEYTEVNRKLKDSGIDIADPSAYKKSAKKTEFGVRFLGYNAPEVVKWGVMDEVPVARAGLKTVTYKDVKDNTKNYHIDVHDDRNDNEKIVVMKYKSLSDEESMNKWIEIKEEPKISKGVRFGEDTYKNITYLHKLGESNEIRRKAAEVAQSRVKEAIGKSVDGYVYLMLNESKLAYKSQRYDSMYEGINGTAKGINLMFYMWSQLCHYQDFTYQGFADWGMDVYGRYLGVPYVKTADGFINITKYVIAGDTEAQGEVFPNYGDTAIDINNNQNLDDYFNMASYDYDRFQVYDLMKSASDYIDDRIAVQEEIFGKSFDELREWTVGIGDTFFIVPPTSIRVSNEVEHERIRTMRSRGSAVKGGTKVDKYIEMDIYFNNEQGINGVPWKTELPNGKEITYFMNGLRALAAQFKFCPFLPIENRYINQVCNIEAVNLLSMQVTSVEGFPRTYVARVVLQAFDWQTYMPDLPANVDIDSATDEDEYFNVFAKSIDYQTMRWYYQRAIRTGNKVAGMNSISKEYIKATLGNNTALQPMAFESSDVTFYLANEERLGQMMQAKMAAIDTAKTHPLLSNFEVEFLEELAEFGNIVNKAVGDEIVQLSINETNASVFASMGVSTDNGESAKDKENDVAIITSKLERDKLIEGMIDHTKLRVVMVKDGKILDNVGKIGEHMGEIQDHMLERIKSGAATNKYYRDVKPIYTIKKGGVDVGVRIYVNMDRITSDTQITNLLSNASAVSSDYAIGQFNILNGYFDITYTIPLGEETTVDTSIAGKIFRSWGWDSLADMVAGRGDNYGIVANLFSTEKGHITTGKDGADMDLLNYAIAYKKVRDKGDNTTNEEVAENAKQLDYISPYTLNYDKYNMGHVAIQNIAISYANTFMKYGLNGTEGYASQYMGSDDAVIEITMHAQDEFTVGMINQMTSTQSRYARDYRLILPACPFRIDSEVTRMMGINEVLIEKIDIETVPSNPGLYDIHISCISMDRTLRSREALNKINDWENNGSVKNSAAAQLRVKTFDNLRSSLSEAEVYPDLELPTIKELSDKGFNFLRHLFDDARSYPDPDFYFVYGYDLQSDVFRKAVESAFKQKSTATHWVDETGGSLNITADNKEVYKGEDMNGNAITMEDLIKKHLEGSQAAPKSKKYVKNTVSLIQVIQSAQDVEGWKVSDEIRVLGMDMYHQELLRQDDAIVAKAKLRGGKPNEERQGKWISDKMKSAREASKLIKKELDKPLDISKAEDRRGTDDYSIPFSTEVVEYISKTFGNALKKINFSEDELNPSMLGLYGKNSEAPMSVFVRLLKCVSAAVSADKEETKSSGKSSNTNFEYLGKCIDNAMNSTGLRRAADLADVRDNGIQFSIFGLQMMKRKKLKDMELYGDIVKNKDRKKGANYEYVMLDPYYRRKDAYSKKGLKEIRDYKTACAKDYYVAAKAYIRIMMLFLAKAIDEYVFPNVQFDLMGEDLQELLGELEKSEKGNKALEQEIEDYSDFLSENDKPINMGKLFISMMCASTQSLDPIEYIKRGDYEKLNDAVALAVNAVGENISTEPESIFYRRFFKKMPYFEILQLEKLGLDEDNAVADRRKEYRERVFLEAVKDPMIYVPHSFHDMTVHDMRGRMAKAFPTFYMILIDEGRRIGMWKLHDNFYNINSISEIAVTKSRKNPADTCKITMSNMFMTYTTNDEDIKLNFEYDYRDVFNSIFNPTAIYEKEETRRMNSQPMNKAKLVPGIRMHVRMGYNGNAANLPVVFNGVIAEVTAGESVEIIGTGDGAELLNPITKPDSKNLDEGTVKTKITSKFNSSQTPYEIFQRLLCNRGDLVARKIDDFSNGYYRSYNEYGIVHFGDPRYDIMFKTGEPMQNIYEAITKPVWYGEDTKSADYGMESPPEIAIKTMGKTSWDVMNIAASMSPDFILGVAPFNMRSTLFHGHPRYYYAYDYYKDDKTGDYLEKRKPYQQYHIVTSYADIIQNNITASANNGMATNAQGIFRTKGYFGGSKESYTNRLYVDWDIYPEYQKSIVYDTGIEYRGNEVIGKIPILGRMARGVSNTMELEGSGKEKAWRATAKALKHGIHDMYTGNIMLTGNPTIKPHDRLELFDTYENITGPVLVESVTHIMSPDTGFTTDIVPDCIAVVDDRFETVTDQTIRSHILPALGYSVVTSGIAAIWGKASPTLSLAAMYTDSKRKQVKKTVQTSEKLVGDTEDALDDEKLKTKRGLKKILSGLKDVVSNEDLLKLTTKAGLAGLTSPVFFVGLLVEMVVSTTIMAAINNKLAHFMRDHQVLEIYPIKKNSKVLTAGLQGNIGSVVGSPTAGMQGFYEKNLGKIMSATDGPVASFIRGLFISDETEAYFNKISKRDMSDNTITQEKTEDARQRMIHQVLSSIAQEEAIKTRGLVKILATPRISPVSSSADDAVKAIYKTQKKKRYDEMRISSIENIGNNPKVVEDLVYIRTSKIIDDACEDRYLRLIWEEQFNSKEHYEQIDFNIPDKGILTKNVAKLKAKNGEDDLLDIPFLAPDALTLLEEVVKIASNYLTSDEKEKGEEEDNFIVLSSCTICGNEKSMAATGLNFKIESSGKDGDVILEKIKKELDETRQKLIEAGIPSSYTGYEVKGPTTGSITRNSKKDNSNKSMYFIVYPRA